MFLKELVKNIAPQYEQLDNLSFVNLCTTNPLYLVFYQNGEYPELVIRKADSAMVIQAHHVNEQLYKIVGDLVAKPVTITTFSHHKVTVVKGLAGKPWFQISQSYDNQEQWNNIRNRALQALQRLQQGIKSVPQWRTEYHLGNELRKCYENSLASGAVFSPNVTTQVNILIEQLSEFTHIPAFSQHGDYCLNNLMIHEKDINIIDFDDFGMTSMPLHDEFSLAFSMFSCAPRKIKTSLKNEINQTLKVVLKKTEITKEMVPGLLMYHLLLRLGEWSAGERRKPFRDWLITVVEQYAKDSCDWIVFE